MSVLYTYESQVDLESIYVYIAIEGGHAAAERVVDAIVSTCEDLALYPEMGRHRPELGDRGFEVRSLGERGYVILYTLHENRLFIIRVIHGARDLGPEVVSEVLGEIDLT